MAEHDSLLKPGVSIKPEVDETDVQEILSEVYGFKCLSIKQLNSYDDSNYHVKVDKDNCTNPHVNSINDDGYVLKIMNSLESKNTQLFEAQDELLIYLGKRNICCPQPVLNKNGKYYIIRTFPSGNHLVKLLEFINGSVLCQVPLSMELFYQSGRFIANLDEALKDFHHAAYANRKSVWLMESVSLLSQFLYAVTDAKRRKIVEEVIEQFPQKVLPLRAQLDTRIIHGDFNEHNILVEQEDGKWFVKGILDFGETQMGCCVYEVAIAMAYLMVQGGSLDVGGHVLAGYVSVTKLSDQELSLLKICIAARLCQSLVMGAYSILQDPANSYILTTAKTGWKLLEELWAEPEDKLLRRWKNIVEETNVCC